MEEKKIIESVNSYKKAVLKIVIVSLIIAVLGIGASFITLENAHEAWQKYENHTHIYGLSTERGEELRAAWKLAYFLDDVVTVIGYTSAVVFLIMLIFYWYVNGMQIIVTNKRVYGRTAFGKQVDLPLDSISAIGTSWFKGIAIATSSGSIKFLGISNRDDIHHAISRLLVERQTKKKAETIYQENQSSADELKKYKDLLDSGVITQEEFDVKKKQLLGL